MAIDTEGKRKSSAMFLMPGYTPLIPPDGSMTQADRQAAAWIYSGILAIILPGIISASFTGRSAEIIISATRPEVAIVGKKSEVAIAGG